MRAGITLQFTDIHCHLLPGIDDGSRDWNVTLAMARLAVADGICTIVATPHQLGNYESVTATRIRELTAETQERITAAGIPLTILPGADVRVHEELPELVRQQAVLTLADRRVHLLMELPHDQILPLEQLIYRLQSGGIHCILSHPERNAQLLHNPSKVRPLVQQGCLVQITAGSITGHFGPQVQRMCRRLLEEQVVHLVATDAHDATRRPPCLSNAYEIVCRWVGLESAQRIFIDNPQAVAEGRPVEAPLPISIPPSGLQGMWERARVVLWG
jgi:protein-tyrosine phosphatase